MLGKQLIAVNKLGKEFNGIRVLKDVDFDLYSGEIHALVGENGAGKSTFIKMLSGIYQPSSGQITVEGSPEIFDSPEKSEMLGIRTVHQEINLVPFFSVAENIFMGNEYLKKVMGFTFIDKKSMRKKTREVLNHLGVELNADKPAHLLDTSMERIVEISQVLVHRPKVIIFDEPTTSLDEKERKRLLEIISELKKTGLGIIYVSHNLEEILSISDRITVFRDGHKIDTIPGQNATAEKIITMMIGTKGFEEYKIEKVDPLPEICLESKDLTTKKLKQVSFQLKSGEILGIAGAVGAGKTELAKAIFGLDPIHNGEIKFNGKKYIPNPRESIRKGIALVPEERQKQGLFLNMSVKNNLTISYLDQWTNRGIMDERKEIETTQHFIEMLNIKTRGHHQMIKFLSGGNQQKVILGRWLSGNFQVGIFDEPTRGIDVKAREDIYTVLHQLSQKGKSILLLSSYLPELLGVCHRILVLRDGKICGEFSPTEERVQEKIISVMLGGGAA